MSEIGQPYSDSGDSAVARMPPSTPAKPVRKTGKLDGAEAKQWHGRLLDWHNEERDRQSVNRYQMAVDEDFYDGLQWTQEDATELMARGQAPLVFNKVKPTINWLLGTERRARFDYKILPREESDEQAAEVKTKVFKYISDANRLPFERSQCFKELVAAGLSYLEEGINTEPGQELIYTGGESWRNVLDDTMGSKLDINQDRRYQFRWRWVDLDVAIAMFPDRKTVLESAAMDADQIAEKDEAVWYMGARTNSELEDFSRLNFHRTVMQNTTTGFSKRRRVKIMEAWYKVPTPAKVMRGSGALDGEIYDDQIPQHSQAVDQGDVSLCATTFMKMRLMIMTESHVLWWGDSPFRHNRFILTPMVCYRRARDGMPYGVIRDIRDAQEDYNKRASKALFILSTARVVMDKGAINAKDLERFREEVARPDGIVEKNKGFELEIMRDTQLGEEHLMLADRDAVMIQDVAGVTDENLGKQTNATSGKAIERRQDQGSIVTAHIFDNYRMAYQISGEKILSLIEQFYTAKKVIRIVGENKPIEWLPINTVDPDTGKPLNDITASRADFIVSEQDYRATLRQAMFEQMMDMLGKIAPVMPQAAINLLDLVIDMTDIASKDEFVKRIREINGQTDPAKKPTPEEIQNKQRTQQQSQAQIQLGLAKLGAEVDKLNSQKGQIDATAFKTIVTGLYEALQAAQIVSTIPNVTPVADVIAQGAGFKPAAGGVDPNIPAPSGTLPTMTPQGIHGDYVGAGDTSQVPQPGAPLQADGAQAGIQTLGNDGVT